MSKGKLTKEQVVELISLQYGAAEKELNESKGVSIIMKAYVVAYLDIALSHVLEKYDKGEITDFNKEQIEGIFDSLEEKGDMLVDEAVNMENSSVWDNEFLNEVFWEEA